MSHLVTLIDANLTRESVEETAREAAADAMAQWAGSPAVPEGAAEVSTYLPTLTDGRDQGEYFIVMRGEKHCACCSAGYYLRVVAQ